MGDQPPASESGPGSWGPRPGVLNRPRPRGRPRPRFDSRGLRRLNAKRLFLLPSGRDLSASVVKRRYGATIDDEDDDDDEDE